MLTLSTTLYFQYISVFFHKIKDTATFLTVRVKFFFGVNAQEGLIINNILLEIYPYCPQLCHLDLKHFWTGKSFLRQRCFQHLCLKKFNTDDTYSIPWNSVELVDVYLLDYAPRGKEPLSCIHGHFQRNQSSIQFI